MRSRLVSIPITEFFAERMQNPTDFTGWILYFREYESPLSQSFSLLSLFNHSLHIKSPPQEAPRSISTQRALINIAMPLRKTLFTPVPLPFNTTSVISRHCLKPTNPTISVHTSFRLGRFRHVYLQNGLKWVNGGFSTEAWILFAFIVLHREEIRIVLLQPPTNIKRWWTMNAKFTRMLGPVIMWFPIAHILYFCSIWW